MVYVEFGRWGVGPWLHFGFNKLQTEVLEDFFDDVRVLYYRGHPLKGLSRKKTPLP